MGGIVELGETSMGGIVEMGEISLGGMVEMEEISIGGIMIKISLSARIIEVGKKNNE